ncbi:MAG: EAL domain-containing protein [bacterium]|nr:EAL domain-containing protein [bacterium]
MAHARTTAAGVSLEDLAQVTLESIGDGVIRTDSAGRVDYMNPVAERLTGWSLEEAMERDVTEAYQVVHESTRRPRRNPIELCLMEKRTIVMPGLFMLKSRHGDEYIIRDSVAPIPGPEGQIVGAVVVFRDLTRIRGLEQRMVYLESHDTLTGMLNRQELEIYLEAALESARDQGLEHTLVYLDLWEFKLINDCYGHVAGDELLRQVAERLKAKIDQRGLLGRVGGDDFTCLLENCSALEARAVVRGLQRAFREFRFNWGGQHFEIGLNVGLAAINASTESMAQILKAANAACYLARQGGRNRIHTYVTDDAVVAERHGRLHWVQRIRTSVAEDRLCLYQQEIRPLKEGGRGLREILVRMVDTTGAHLMPGGFIPIAEHHDLASSIDRWVIRHSLSLLERDHASGGPVSINLSGQSLGDEGFLEDVLGYLETARPDPDRVFFEITETAAVANLGRALHFIAALKDMGCRFILDDFGSGLSSFAYLKNLPVDILKIDGEFVRSMESDPIRRAMVASINQIAQVMGIETIAEWVETEATYEMLRELGVDYVQGFWLHRPEPF